MDKDEMAEAVAEGLKRDQLRRGKSEQSHYAIERPLALVTAGVIGFFVVAFILWWLGFFSN